MIKRSVFALVLALGSTPISLVGGIPPTLANAAEPLPEITEAERAEFRVAFFKGGSPTLRTILEDFPEEYRALETRLMQGIKSGTLSKAQQNDMVREFALSILPRIYEGWTEAPDDVLLTLLHNRIAALKVLPPDLCVRFIEADLPPAVLSKLTPAQRELTSQAIVDRANAARAARSQPTPRSAPTQDELAVARRSFIALGGDQTWMAAFMKGEEGGFSDAANCQNRRLWLEAMAAQPPPVAARILTH